MPKNDALAPDRGYPPDSALHEMVEIAVQLVMEVGLDAAEGYLQAQGVSRYSLIAPANADTCSLAPTATANVRPPSTR